MRGQKVITKGEITVQLEQAGPVERALIVLGTKMGLRLTERLGITFGEMNGDSLRLVSAKNGIVKALPIPAAVKATITDLKTHYQAQGHTITDNMPLFISRNYRSTGKALSKAQASKRIKDLNEALGLERCASHAHRKAFCTAVYDATGNNPFKTITLTRHKSVATLQSYIDNGVSDAEAAEIMNAIN